MRRKVTPNQVASYVPSEEEAPADERRPEAANLAALGHDLRNALGAIVSALHILRLQGYINPVAEQASTIIWRQTEHLELLAEQLSSAAGGGSGRTMTETPLRGRPANVGRAELTGRRRILVVDDNQDAADSTGTLLLLWGHEVRVSYDGERALALAREFRPDICLLDIAMPKMSGYDLAERLRREPGLEGTLLVAMTGFEQEDERRSRSAGFEAYLVKPVELMDLQELLAMHSRQCKMRDMQASQSEPPANHNGPPHV